MKFDELIHQKSYEHIIHVLRRHPLTFIPTILMFVVLGLMPFGVEFIFANTYPDLLVENNPRALLLLFGSFYYLTILIFFYERFTDYYLDMWVVTNDRIINVEQKGLFARTVAEVDLYKILDVTSDIKGIFPSIFNYGNINLQTAGAELRFNFYNVPKPHLLRKEIIELIREDRKYHVHSETGPNA